MTDMRTDIYPSARLLRSVRAKLPPPTAEAGMQQFSVCRAMPHFHPLTVRDALRELVRSGQAYATAVRRNGRPVIVYRRAPPPPGGAPEAAP